MTIKIIEGFDLYADIAGVSEVWGIVGGITLSTSAGRFGQGAIYGATTGDYITFQDTDNNDYATCGFAFKTSLGSFTRIWANSYLAASSNTSAMNAAILINADGSVTLEGAATGDKGTSASGIVEADTWYYAEVKFHRNNAGSLEFFINGTSIVSASGDFYGSNLLSSYMFGNDSNVADCTIDDIYINTDPTAIPAIKGDCRVSTLLPNADTAQADWTPLSGTGFSNIDDALGTNGDGATSYISATTLNNKSEFDIEDLAESPTVIHAIAIGTRASKSDAGTIEYTQYIDSSGVESAGTPNAPSETTYAFGAIDIFETDPNTAAAWTEAGVNAVKLGVEITG